VAVVGKDSDSVTVMRRDGTQAALNLQHADRFEVYRTREIGFAKGERIRITKNGGDAKVEAHGLLKQRDEERKAKTLNDARTLLASVGLTLKDH